MTFQQLIHKWGGPSKFSRMTGMSLSTCLKISSGANTCFDQFAIHVDCWLEQGNRDKDYDKREEL